MAPDIRLPASNDLRLTPVEQIPHLELRYDHAEIVEIVAQRLRAKCAERADLQRLLSNEFTLLELERVHEVIAGQRLTIDGFRRRMVRNERVVETGRTSVGTVGKPARFYRRAEV